MQIKEFEALTLKECLQRVRDDMGPEAVILETRKFRRGGLLGMGAHEAICIVAATGITVQNDLPAQARRESAGVAVAAGARSAAAAGSRSAAAAGNGSRTETETTAAATAHAARNVYARAAGGKTAPAEPRKTASEPPAMRTDTAGREAAALSAEPLHETRNSKHFSAPDSFLEAERFAGLERAMHEIREGLMALRTQQEAHEKTVTAVVTAAAAPRPASAAEEPALSRFPELQQRLMQSGVAPAFAEELLDSLPDFDAWSTPAQLPMAEAALRDLMSRRIPCAGPIVLTPGRLKAVALIGPTGVGKTTTIAKLAAHFSLVEGKRVALLTVDTYRIAAVEQLKTYSQIIDIPIGVAYSQAEVLPAVAQFADYDLLLIDTAGRSQKNIMQVGELKALLETLNCETHLVLSAPVKEDDMVEAARRFSAACVDRLLFSKLDETNSYGTLLNVADRVRIPLSYVTTGQKVPEDIETADGRRLTDMILNPQ